MAKQVRGAIHQNANMDLLYLDLALEDVVRAAAEGAVADVPSLHVAAAVFAPLLENLCLSTPANHELCVCLRDWQRLPDGWCVCAPLRAPPHSHTPSHTLSLSLSAGWVSDSRFVRACL